MSSPAGMKRGAAKPSYEELEIRYKQALNELRLTQQESKESSFKYMELLSELNKRHLELHSIKAGLEGIVKSKTSELQMVNGALARELEERSRLERNLSDLNARLTGALKASEHSIALCRFVGRGIVESLSRRLEMLGKASAAMRMEIEGQIGQDMRSLARLLSGEAWDSGKEDGDFKIDDLVPSLVELFRGCLKDAGIGLDLKSVDGLPERFRCDPLRFRQLLASSLFAMRELCLEGARIELSLSRSGEGGGLDCSFSIHGGLSIAAAKEFEEALDRIFSGKEPQSHSAAELSLGLCAKLAYLLDGGLLCVGKGAHPASLRFAVKES